MASRTGNQRQRIPLGLREDFRVAELAYNNRSLRITAIAALAVSLAYVVQNILAPLKSPETDRLIWNAYAWGFGDLALLSAAYLAWSILFARARTDRIQGAIQTVYAGLVLLAAAFITAIDLSHQRDYSAISYATMGLALSWRCGHRKAAVMFLGAASASVAFLAMGGTPLDAGAHLPILVAAVIATVAAAILEAGWRRSYLLQEELRELSSRDPLTGLRNRRFLNESASLLVAAARRNEAQTCVLVFDIDHFKSINDEFGHLTGDEVLKAIGRILGSSLRTSDLVVRFGGEEFLAVLVDTSLEGGILAAERLRRLVGGLEHPGLDRRVTVSCGLAELGKDEKFDDCVARADTKLYEAKHAGRNRTEY